MKCADTQKYLFAFVDGELTKQTNIELVHHLLECPSCSEKFAREESFRRSVGQCGMEGIPETLRCLLEKLQMDG